VFSKAIPVVSGKGVKKGTYVIKTIDTSTGLFGAEVLTANKNNDFNSNQTTQGMYATLVDGVLTVTFTVAPSATTLVLVDYLLAATAYASYTDANNKQSAPGGFYFEFDSLSEDHTYLVSGTVSRQVKMSK